jgi:hypothetical protein
LKIIERYAVAIISRHTSSVPNEDVVFPRLLYCDSRCFETSCQCLQKFPQTSQALCQRFQSCGRDTHVLPGVSRCSQVHPKFSLMLRGAPKLITIPLLVLVYKALEIVVRLKAGWNVLLGSDALLEWTCLSVHSITSLSLLDAPID